MFVGLVMLIVKVKDTADMWKVNKPAAAHTSQQLRISSICLKTMSMPDVSRSLSRVIEHKDSNRMSVQSMAIVFGPTLLRPETESADMTIHMVFQSQIVELMLKEFQTIFSQK